MPSDEWLKNYYQEAVVRADDLHILDTRVSEHWMTGIGETYFGLKGADLSVHDIGCGFGSAVHQMRCADIDATGSDISSKPIQMANDKGLEHVYCGQFDEVLSALGRRVHVAAMMHLVEHIVEPVSFLKRVTQILRPGGLAVCAVPNANYLPTLISNITNHPWFSFPNHLHYFTPASLVRTFQAAGFDVLTVYGGPNVLPPLDSLPIPNPGVFRSALHENFLSADISLYASPSGTHFHGISPHVAAVLGLPTISRT
jgi:2-polyprenyl-3-methyl-5-hydroxy-6-metoxy-1,4-benzoquinol methylase